MSKTNNTRQAAWMALGNFFSFLVGIITPMILSRFFNKNDYGTYKQVMYVYTTLLTVFTLGLPKAYSYFIPKVAGNEQKSLINKITAIFVVLGSIFSLFLFICSDIIASLLKNPDLSTAIKYFSPVPLLLLPTLGIDGIYASYKKNQFLVLYHLSTKLLIILCTTLPVLIYSGTYLTAIIGFDIASLFTCLLALFMKSKPTPHCESIKTDVTYKQIFSFSIPLLAASIWGIIINSSNQFFISRFYGNEEFANFSNGFIELPFIGMMLAAVSAVLLPIFSKQDKGDGLNIESYNTWMSTLKKTSKIIFPLLIFCVCFAKLMMICMYGDIYADSKIYFQIKNISGLLYIIPFAPIIIALGKTKAYAHVHMIVAILIVCLDWVACKLFDSPIAIAIASELANAVKLLLILNIVAKYAKRSILSLFPLSQLLKTLLISVASAFITYIVSCYVDFNKYMLLVFCFALYCMIYYTLCWIFKMTYKDIVSSFIKKDRLLKYIP